MKQLALGIVDPPAPTFDNFVAGRNAELLAVLRSQCRPGTTERMVYLWGDPGSGRTHLLGAAARAAERSGRLAAWFPGLADAASGLLLVDDVERLDAAAQAVLFARYNEARDAGGCLLAAGSVAPARLPLRPDLLTRLAWGLAYQVHALTDEDKSVALEQHARARGLRLPAEVSAYLLRHERRDLPSLMAMLDALDGYSLEVQRPITLPLLRELLQARAVPAADTLKEDTL
jgi:DnaA family protein